jgi:hypothetical protein
MFKGVMDEISITKGSRGDFDEAWKDYRGGI